MDQLLLPLDRKPTCHPERRYHAKGLCEKCYLNAWRKDYWHSHPEYRKKAKATQRKWELRNPDKAYQRSRKHHLKRKYGITIEQSRALFNANDGYCWICGESPAEGIDHCHKTGEVRGALCRQCNLGIGHLDDNLELVLKAAQYLKTGKVITPHEQSN